MVSGQQEGFEAGVGSLPLKDKPMGDDPVPGQVLVTPVSWAFLSRVSMNDLHQRESLFEIWRQSGGQIRRRKAPTGGEIVEYVPARILPDLTHHVKHLCWDAHGAHQPFPDPDLVAGHQGGHVERLRQNRVSLDACC